MYSIINIRWKTLEQWSPTLLYIAGALSIYFALQNISAFRLPSVNTYMAYVLPVSSIIAIAGVLGLYPRLSDPTPRLSRAGAAFLAVAAVTIAVGFFTSEVAKATQARSLHPFLSSIRYTHLISGFAGYLLFGIAILNTDRLPAFLGYILLIPAAFLTVDAIQITIQSFSITRELSFTISIIEALAYLTIGFMLSYQNKITNAEIAAPGTEE